MALLDCTGARIVGGLQPNGPSAVPVPERVPSVRVAVSPRPLQTAVVRRFPAMILFCSKQANFEQVQQEILLPFENIWIIYSCLLSGI